MFWMESKSRRLLQKASRLYLGAILLTLKAQLSTVTTRLLPALKLCSSLHVSANAATCTERRLQINVAVSRSFQLYPGNTNSSPGKILGDSPTWIPTFSANTKNWARP